MSKLKHQLIKAAITRYCAAGLFNFYTSHVYSACKVIFLNLKHVAILRDTL